MKKGSYKYDIITESGNQESWTGPFKTRELSDQWYNKWGKWWEKRGKILIEFVSNREEELEEN